MLDQAMATVSQYQQRATRTLEGGRTGKRTTRAVPALREPGRPSGMLLRRRRRASRNVPGVGPLALEFAGLVILLLVVDLDGLEDQLDLLHDVAFLRAALRNLGDESAFHEHREIGLRAALAGGLHHLELQLRERLAGADVAEDHGRRGVEVVLEVELA